MHKQFVTSAEYRINYVVLDVPGPDSYKYKIMYSHCYDKQASLSILFLRNVYDRTKVYLIAAWQVHKGGTWGRLCMCDLP